MILAMRRSAVWLLAAMALVGCDASGSTQGGTLLAETGSCSAGNLSPTWTNLYECYFGPSGKASCAGQGICHVTPNVTNASSLDLATGSTYWVCGGTRESCWQGVWNGELVCFPQNKTITLDAGCEAGPADAASDSSSNDAATESGESDAGPAVDGSIDGSPTGSTCQVTESVCEVPSDPTTTYLWLALRGSGTGNVGSQLEHNMPCDFKPGSPPLCTGPGGYTFTQQDLALISAWISGGAQDN
jgi:hypothetical protein